MTVEQYYEITVEGDRKQLVDGAIVVSEPKLVHAELQARLIIALRAWTDAERGRGVAFLPTDVVIDEHNLYAPDVVWIAEPNRPATLHGYPERVPDLCVEIRSPGTWRYDVGAKRSGYERAGTPELWLVDDRAECVLVYRRSGPDAPTFDVALELAAGEALTSPQLPGFELPIGDLFRGVSP
jgi:Uma2 family endonuclease